MKKKNNNRQKIVFSKKRLGLIFFLVCLAILLLYLSWGLAPELKYVKQFCALGGYICVILAFYHLGKLFTREIRDELYKRLSKAIFAVAEKLRAIFDKVRDKLGIKKSIRLHTSDEVSIIINDERIRQKKQKPLTKRKFSQLDNDCDRIRFMYIKFIEYKQKKKGNCHPYDTPCELEKKTADTETEHELFDLYTPVRYAEVPLVSPEEVKNQYDYLISNRIVSAKQFR